MIKFIKNYFVEFRRHLFRYLALYWGLSIFLIAVVVPFFGWLASKILGLSSVGYLSSENFLVAIVHYPLAMVALIALVFILIVVVYVQFAFTLLAVKAIQEGESVLKVALPSSFKRLKLLKPRNFAFFVLYFLLVLPFSSSIFSSPLLSKVQVPTFIVDFIAKSPVLYLVFFAVIHLFYLLGIIILFVLPTMILKEISLREAFRENRRILKGRYIKFAFALVGISFFAILMAYLSYFLVYFLQVACDSLPRPWDFFSAVLNMGLGQLLGSLITAFSSVLLFSIIIKELGVQVVAEKEKTRRSTKIGLFVFFAICTLGVLLSNDALLLFPDKPLTISHRGVDAGNGVQNTIPALEATSKEEPDYIEMDIQETKDHQFVVMHDANLKALTGVNSTPQKMTLNQVTQLTAHENGKSAPVASFDAYFSEAIKLHQKLLIEIKTSSNDSADLLNIFLKKYEAKILKNGDMVHSLNYTIIANLAKKAPKVKGSFIMPYNIIFPSTKAYAYTMEETTLDTNFVEDAHANNQKVFAWTVNETSDIDRMLSLYTDGIITDNLASLKEEINTYYNQPKYADRVLINLMSVPPTTGSVQN